MEDIKCDGCGLYFQQDIIHDCDMNLSGQKKHHSLIESIVNVIVGFTINVFANVLIFPLFGIKMDLEKSFGIGLVFTIISVVRSYILRRFFNKIMLRKI